MFVRFHQSINFARVSYVRISEAEFAKSLNLGVPAVALWHRSGRGPKFMKIGQQIFYHQEDIQSFLLSCLRAPGKIEHKDVA